MPSTLIQPSTAEADADLVASSRAGDREAFGRIVRRYQSMVTGLLYASCGDIHSSEDLAQETFISAWRSLSGLRDPDKLPAWLCQIARHRLQDQVRSRKQGNGFATPADPSIAREQATEVSAEETVLSQEERELLWRTLREIPQPYRETLVLYYRQGKSVAQVALAMETSEANVRQRLARGRQMLREQVAAMLERNLGRSAPGAAFAVAVVAALPALIPHSVSAATVGAGAGTGVAKGVAAASKGAGVLAAQVMWIGPVLGMLGGAFGTYASIRSATNPRERRFVVRFAVLVWTMVLSSMALLFAWIEARRRYHVGDRTYIVGMLAFWAVYCAALIGIVIGGNRTQRRIRCEEGLPDMSATPSGTPDVHPITPKVMSLVRLSCYVGGLSWMIVLATRAQDLASVMILTIAIALGMTAGWFYLRGRPRDLANLRLTIFADAAVMALVTFVMLNWKFHAWLAVENGVDELVLRRRVPVWSVNALATVIYLFILASLWVSLRRLPRRA